MAGLSIYAEFCLAFFYLMGVKCSDKTTTYRTLWESVTTLFGLADPEWVYIHVSPRVEADKSEAYHKGKGIGLNH